MKTYTSEEILSSQDLYELQGTAFKYKMTVGEIGWLDAVRSKYSISNWIDGNLEGDVLTFNDPQSVAAALENDGHSCKAAMLSDETALQRLFFWLAGD